MASYVGIGHAAALVLGISALHLALKLAGVKHGDFVFCSDLAFFATANPITLEKPLKNTSIESALLLKFVWHAS